MNCCGLAPEGVLMNDAERHALRAGAVTSDGKHNPGTAAVLSVVIPGVGQIYNGDFLRGIFWLIITPGFWIGTGGLFGWVCHLIASYTAYQRAVRRNAQVAAPSA